MRTLEQQRAEDALARVTALEDKLKPDYRSYTDSLGPTILMNGLGQALASEISAAGGDRENAHHVLYENVRLWLCREDGVYPGASDLLRAVVENEEALYLRAQAEALAWLEWHKKFCRAYLPASEGRD